MFIRTPYNYDRDQASIDSGLMCLDPSLAQQQFKEECDINTIVRRFGVTGQLPVANVEAFYGDFSQVTDYRGALDLIRASGEAFLGLPSGVRERFGHDPARLMDFLRDEANRDEAVKLGLVRPPAAPAAAAPASGSSS